MRHVNNRSAPLAGNVLTFMRATLGCIIVEGWVRESSQTLLSHVKRLPSWMFVTFGIPSQVFILCNSYPPSQIWPDWMCCSLHSHHTRWSTAWPCENGLLTHFDEHDDHDDHNLWPATWPCKNRWLCPVLVNVREEMLEIATNHITKQWKCYCSTKKCHSLYSEPIQKTI